MSKDLIRVTQLPVIENRLLELKDEIKKRTDEAMSLVCDIDSLQTVKDTRADLNKQSAAIESVRKAVKKQIMEPYDRFENGAYKEVIELFKTADADLKRKIDETEGAIKAECEERCVAYFRELCAVHGVDFVSWQQLNIKIDLTSAKQKTPRKLFDQINEKVAAIADGMGKIDRESDPADRDEIMSEYKRCLDVGTAVLRVQDHKNRLKAEQQATAEREERRRAEQEAEAKVEAVIAATVPPVKVKAEPLLTVAFKATATRDKLIALREWMKAEGIRYE